MVVTQLNQEQIIQLIKEHALKLGFFDCGISPISPLNDDCEFMESWLSKGFHGEMTYLERNRQKRYHPDKLVEGAQSVISVLYNYYPEETLAEDDNYKISKYAYGKDYHYIIKEKLKALLALIQQHTPSKQARVFVDSAPVLDRAWARKSGLGFIGKNTMLIHKKGGSFFFIGHIILDLELDGAAVEVRQACGSCNKCIEACPTAALQPFELDARKCISYLTIEHKGDLNESYKTGHNNWIVGCDICQDACPWNRFAKAHQETLFNPSDELKRLRKKDWETMDKSTFNKLFRHTAVERTGYPSLKRNIEAIKDQPAAP